MCFLNIDYSFIHRCRISGFCSPFNGVYIFSTSNMIIIDSTITGTAYVDSFTYLWTVYKNTGTSSSYVWTQLSGSELNNLAGRLCFNCLLLKSCVYLYTWLVEKEQTRLNSPYRVICSRRIHKNGWSSSMSTQLVPFRLWIPTLILRWYSKPIVNPTTAHARSTWTQVTHCKQYSRFRVQTGLTVMAT